VPRPELFQALGEVYAAMGKADQAKQWRGRALEKYLAAAAAGSTHYDHHIAGFYSDTEPNPAEAVRWAKKDLESRHSIYAYDALAWALYQAGDYKPAAVATDKALGTGTRDAHLLYHASLIYYRAGDAARAKDCLRRAGEANPKFTEFHVHR
jgi:tetratricopeptide (TPR) repeat protein